MVKIESMIGNIVEVDRNQVNQEPNQEPGSVLILKPSNQTRNQ